MGKFSSLFLRACILLIFFMPLLPSLLLLSVLMNFPLVSPFILHLVIRERAVIVIILMMQCNWEEGARAENRSSPSSSFPGEGSDVCRFPAVEFSGRPVIFLNSSLN